MYSLGRIGGPGDDPGWPISRIQVRELLPDEAGTEKSTGQNGDDVSKSMAIRGDPGF